MRVLLVLMLALTPTLAPAQHHPPRFQNYPAAGYYTGPCVALKLRPGTNAWYFRTRIREAAKGRPNFAGHYVLATWGCGAECLSSVVIDVQTGVVYFNNATTCCWFSRHAPNVAADFEPIDFRLTSRLVIFTGLLNEEGRNGPHYFKFEHDRLIALP